MAPCTQWITGDGVADCCSTEVSSGVLFDVVAEKASDILFELSGRLFAGTCSKVVRPCRTNCLCGWQVLSRGHIVGPWDLGYWYPGWYCDGVPCGCQPLSRVKLSGYPVQEITEIKIDGVAIAGTEYRLDHGRYVTRKDNGQWPGCQNLSLDDTEEGTWSIEYTYGQDPPEIGVEAAAQLACELYKACQGENCALPIGATRITRQGVTFERQFWRRDPVTRAWRTGLSLVDAFLNAYNPSGILRRPVFWAPSTTRRYAPEINS